MTLHAIARSVVLVMALAVCGLGTAEERTPKEKFGQAVALMEAQKFAEALPILEEMATSYPTQTVFWNLGLSAAEVGENAKALRAWQAYRRANPESWQGRAKLIQAYQALGDLEARDRERADLVALWKAGTNKELSDQQVFCREQFRQDGHKVMALEYFNPSGERMVVYSFQVLDKVGKQEFRVSLGSYDNTNDIALELGERPKDKRLYHLDLYRQNMHETHGFFVGQPTYDVVRPLVADVIAGRHKASSGSARSTPG